MRSNSGHYNLQENKKKENLNLENSSDQKPKQTEGLINFNLKAKEYIPKQKRQGQIECKFEPLKLNLDSAEYIPRSHNQTIQGTQPKEFIYYEPDDQEEAEELEDEIICQMLQEQVDFSDEESDCEKWFPEFRTCDCCEGYVYLCNGEVCKGMGYCYCKMQKDLDS